MAIRAAPRNGRRGLDFGPNCYVLPEGTDNDRFFREGRELDLMEICRPTAIDLFCGCGGMGLGLEQAGYDVLYANDVSKDATETYRTNLRAGIVECKDIAQVDPAEVQRKIGRPVDLIVAGTPCQGFSTLGKRDPGDPRNSMFKHLARFLRELKPKIFVMENVRGILTMRRGWGFTEIRDKLEEAGYLTTCMNLNAANYGVPQNRERVFLIGFKGNSGDLIQPQRDAQKATVRDAISDLEFLDYGEESRTYQRPPETNYQRRMRGECTTLLNHKAPLHSRKVRDRFAAIPSGSNGKRLSGTGKRDCYKMDPNSQSRTVTTLPEDLVHYCRDRIPTVRELARIQSFPDWFLFAGPRTTGGMQRKVTCCQYTQVGNAVPPMLARRLFESIIPMLDLCTFPEAS